MRASTVVLGKVEYQRLVNLHRGKAHYSATFRVHRSRFRVRKEGIGHIEPCHHTSHRLDAVFRPHCARLHAALFPGYYCNCKLSCESPLKVEVEIALLIIIYKMVMQENCVGLTRWTLAGPAYFTKNSMNLNDSLRDKRTEMRFIPVDRD